MPVTHWKNQASGAEAISDAVNLTIKPLKKFNLYLIDLEICRTRLRKLSVEFNQNSPLFPPQAFHLSVQVPLLSVPGVFAVVGQFLS